MPAGMPGLVRGLRDRLLAEMRGDRGDGVCSQRHSVTSGHSYFGCLGQERSKAQEALSRSRGLRSEAHGQPRSGVPTGEGRADGKPRCWRAEVASRDQRSGKRTPFPVDGVRSGQGPGHRYPWLPDKWYHTMTVAGLAGESRCHSHVPSENECVLAHQTFGREH